MSSLEPRPFLSILLVSYHSRKDLERCLPSLYSQENIDFEVIVVDNAPSDGTAIWLEKTYPRVKVIPNAVNTGYAGGNNLGLKHAKGEWVFVLNPDTWLYEGSLATLLAAAQRYPDALINPKLLNPDGSVNACGLAMHYTGIVTCRGLGVQADTYTGLQSAPLASGAALLARREVFIDLGGFDESYFMYLEDADLSLRARLKGYSIFCAADAHVEHLYTLGISPKKFFYLERNRLLTLFKLLERSTLLEISSALFLTELATWAFALLRGPRYLLAKLQSYYQLWRGRAAWKQQRRGLQMNRHISDPALLQSSHADLPLTQLISNPGLSHFLTLLTEPLYRFSRPRNSRA